MGGRDAGGGEAAKEGERFVVENEATADESIICAMSWMIVRGRRRVVARSFLARAATLLFAPRPSAPTPLRGRFRSPAAVSRCMSAPLSGGGNKLATAGALFAFACVTFSAPIVLSGKVSNPLYTSSDPMPVAAVRRGAFMNSGSKDVGLDVIDAANAFKKPS